MIKFKAQVGEDIASAITVVYHIHHCVFSLFCTLDVVCTGLQCSYYKSTQYHCVNEYHKPHQEKI